MASAGNLLISNNRLPKSGEDDFKMNGYVVQATERGKKGNAYLSLYKTAGPCFSKEGKHVITYLNSGRRPSLRTSVCKS